VRTGLIAGGGLALGAAIGALVGARSGQALRGAALGAALLGGLGALTSCVPATGGPSAPVPGRAKDLVVGTVPSTVTTQVPSGTERVQGTRRGHDGVEYEVDETITTYREVERGVTSPLVVRGETRFEHLDALLGAVDIAARATAEGMVVVRRDADGVLVGRGLPSLGGSPDPTLVGVTEPSVVAVVGAPMYLESSNWRELEHPVTYGPAATASDRATIDAAVR